MDDLGITVFALIFVIMIVALSSFFIPFGGDAGDLVDPGDNLLVPYSPIYGADDVEYDENGTPITIGGEPVVPKDDFANMFLGAALIIGGMLLIPVFGSGVALVIPGVALLSGGYIMVSSYAPASNFVSGLPIIGNIYGGMNYVATAIGSFGKLVSFDSSMLNLVPGGAAMLLLLAMLFIVIPVVMILMLILTEIGLILCQFVLQLVVMLLQVGKHINLIMFIFILM